MFSYGTPIGDTVIYLSIGCCCCCNGVSFLFLDLLVIYYTLPPRLTGGKILIYSAGRALPLDFKTTPVFIPLYLYSPKPLTVVIDILLFPGGEADDLPAIDFY